MEREINKNILQAIKRIEAKGWSYEEAKRTVLNIFEDFANDETTIEWYIEKVATKEDWLKEQERYGYLFQGGWKSYPVGY